MTTLRRDRKQGFTLIELLVVIAIILILAAILTPAVLGGLARARRTEMIANGRSIAQAMTGGSLQDPLVTATGSMPPANTTLNSHQFFHGLVTNGYLNVQAGFFGGAGVPKESGPATALTADGNAWQVIAGLSAEEAATTPLVVTKNIPTTYNQLNNTAPDPLQNIQPFRLDGLVVATVGGSALFMTPEVIRSEWTNMYDAATMVTNAVLDP